MNSKFCYIKLSCPDNNNDSNKFGILLDTIINQKSVVSNEQIENIPNNLNEINSGDLILIHIGGDSAKKRRYFTQNPLHDYQNAIYAIAELNSVDANNKTLNLNIYPLQREVTKKELYVYPQFLDNIGCATKGSPNQAGIYFLEKTQFLGFVEYLEINNILGQASCLVSKFIYVNKLNEGKDDFFDSNPLVANALKNTNKKNLLSSEVTSERKIFFGAPGTGKSHTVKGILKDTNAPDECKQTVTFHPEYDYSSFVGGYKPITEDGDIKYKFVPQAFINSYVKAWQDPNNQYYLVIEEINRGNCAEIFGDIFQILDNTDQAVEPSHELRVYIENDSGLGADHDGIKNGLKMPCNLAIYATMNTSDQSLFPMDSAFKRRWDWEYIPINYERNNNQSAYFEIAIDNERSFSWLDFIEKVNNRIKFNDNLGVDKCIGNYFIDATKSGNKIELKTFINKVVFYLWNDVFKDEDDTIFPENTCYEDFFPTDIKGKDLVLQVLNDLEVNVSDSAQKVADDENTD